LGKVRQCADKLQARLERRTVELELRFHLCRQSRIGRGGGARFILSRKFHSFLGQGGAYTRRKGLDCETNKALLVRHLTGVRGAGAAFTELQQVLPALSRRQIQGLLEDLRRAGKVVLEGKRRYALWRLAAERQEPARKEQDSA
jgi:hypothetical protein